MLTIIIMEVTAQYKNNNNKKAQVSTGYYGTEDVLNLRLEKSETIFHKL